MLPDLGLSRCGCGRSGGNRRLWGRHAQRWNSGGEELRGGGLIGGDIDGKHAVARVGAGRKPRPRTVCRSECGAQSRERGTVAEGAENRIVAGRHRGAGKVVQCDEKLLRAHLLKLSGR